MTVSTIRQIKQQIQQLTNGESDNQQPSFWFTDWLVHVIDKPAIALMTDEDYQLSDSEVARFNDGVVKMQQGIPLAYLTGQQEFWSLSFRVNEHTLIPRPDTEVLVEQVLNWINVQPVQLNTKRLLDLGTGSGCIAISLAYELKHANWQIVAVDLSSEALEVAQHNAVSNNVANVEFIQSSWYQALPICDEPQFDIIVSNPPYIDETDEHLAGLTAEPISALSAPNQGLADIEHIVQQATIYLCTGGLLAIEHGYDQGNAVRKLFLDSGFESVHTVKDYGGNDRVTLGQVQ
ncbi:Peptide chain release factor N(5)-glutamine methyltransferase [Psychrobacter nivimaris]|uniref:Release factor glutamine methyltransferase n=1 Tax=Psychrobacter nivimaris TaxID=281738 RepID=A0A6N7BYZ2_9GAMM|nr:peptide chain release factor N(5)-glutamine methyltransferase [Psychrobacter nivimaris]KAF0568844.1 Peptide chain release factor N(5)-glutamine methyltransferase [Psychrobacter nivimaris]|tara:strand:+ start:262 stop:1134 length:873 start_codon:yes stop_codon:yes gene_type:complete